MYLTKRDNGYRFQRRIPKTLESILGSSPIRIHLGHLSACKAKLASRLLASHSDRLFLDLIRNRNQSMPDTTDPRDALIAELRAQMAASIEETRLALESADQIIQLQDRLHIEEMEKQANEITKAAMERELGLRQELKRVHTSYLDTQATVLDVLNKAKAQRATPSIELVSTKLDAFEERFAALHTAVEANLDGGYVRPLMSVALDEWHNEIRMKQGIKEKKTDTDYSRLQDFIEFAGDRPVNKYKFFDFQKFKNLLAWVPSNYSKIPALRGMTREEAAEYNRNLPPDDRLETLSMTTIESNYFSPLQVFFQDIAAQHDFKSPLTDVKVRLPRFTKGKKTRRPFSVEELNKWFPIAAKAQRAEMKWIPLLGAVLGARVGELVPLQGKDIYQVEGGVWVIDLTTDLIDDQGDAEGRQLKNESSRRVIALPDFIGRTGFIDYVKTRRPEDYMFPACFYHGKERVKDPAGAASKRLNAQLKKVGIHREIETTFHSTRHTAVDFH